MKDILAYYTLPSHATDPGPYAECLAQLPRSVPDLVELVQGLVIDKDFLDLYEPRPAGDRLGEVDTRYFSAMLALLLRMDARPLTNTRQPVHRLVGSCRDYALVLCALLRRVGIAARLRCGFSRYLRVNPDVLDDHWVCEYWNGEGARWVLVDANVDAGVRQKYSITIDTLDLPRDQFLIAGDAWRMARQGEIDPDQLGVSSIGIHGLWFARGSVVRDLACLNKVEVLPWDYWGLSDAPRGSFPFEQLEALDHAANATSSADNLPMLRELFLRDGFRPPDKITSYSPASGRTEVILTQYADRLG